MRLVCDGGANLEGSLSLGTSIAACLIFLLTFPFVLLNFRRIPIGTMGALLSGAFLMTAVVLGSSGLFTVVGDDRNLRIIFLSLGIMVLVQYFQRENIFSIVLKRMLTEDITFLHFLSRVTFATFVTSALFSIDTSSLVVTPIVLQIWRTQRRPVTQLQILLLGIATSANIGSVFTVHASLPVAIIASRTAALSGENRLDMVSSCVYLAVPAFVGYTLNLLLLIAYFKIKGIRPPGASKGDVIELQNVEQSLITPNAIIDHIIEDSVEVPPRSQCTALCHSYSTNCVQTPKVQEKSVTSKSFKSVEFLDSPRLPNFSVGDINAKGVRAQGPPSLYIGTKLDVDEAQTNKDQCHSLYNLDKIGYIAVSERHGKDETGMPRTISFYHSFSDLDSWQYTRDSVVNKFEHNHPRDLPLSPLTRRRASSRGRLESVQFNRLSKRQRARQRRTSVLYQGLMSDALRLLTKSGVYRAFSAMSPTIQFLVGRREDVNNLVDMVNREFVQSKSRFFRFFLIFTFVVMTILFFVRVPYVNFDIGLLPAGAVVIVILVDAVWNRRNCTLILRRLNWGVIVSYFAMFVFIKGLTVTNIPLWIWSKMDFLSNSFNNPISVIIFACLIIVFTHAFGGVTLTLIVLDIPTCSSSLPQLVYLLWCIVMASNMTLHGSASTLMVSQKATEIVQCELTYLGYVRYGFISSLVILIVGLGLIAGIISVVGEDGIYS